jgi:hypothetical protein
MLVPIVAIMLYGALFVKNGTAIFMDSKTLSSFGNLAGFYIVTCGWGVIIGVALSLLAFAVRNTKDGIN